MRLELRSREDVHAGCDDDPAPVGILYPVGVRDQAPCPDAHPEDAFLAELDVFLRRSYRLDARERAVASEIARDALDLVEGLDENFTRLPATSWLDAALVAGRRQRVGAETTLVLALAFVTFLRVQGRIDLAGARRLRRALAARRRPAPALARAA